MTDEIRALLARHRPGYDVTSVAKLGVGLDNITYDINGELIVRQSKEADHVRRSKAILREAALLATVAGLPVPEPVLADAEAGVVAYPRLPGVPLMDHPVADPTRLRQRDLAVLDDPRSAPTPHGAACATHRMAPADGKRVTATSRVAERVRADGRWEASCRS